MTKLGIIGAMDVEVSALKENLKDMREHKHAVGMFYEGMLEGLPVVIVQCGIGEVNAALCVQILCDCYGVNALVNTGIAGSLCADLDIGDMVVSKDAMYHDFDCHAFGYPVGKVPGLPVTFEADEKLIGYAVAAAEAGNPGHTKTGRVASGDQFICEKAQKEHIISVTQALCTEMAGAGIAQPAHRNELPFVILRAISDKADDSAEMDYPTFEAIAADRCARGTMAMAKQIREAEEK